MSYSGVGQETLYFCTWPYMVWLIHGRFYGLDKGHGHIGDFKNLLWITRFGNTGLQFVGETQMFGIYVMGVHKQAPSRGIWVLPPLPPVVVFAKSMLSG